MYQNVIFYERADENALIVDFKNDTSLLNDQNNLTLYPIGGKVSLLEN